MAAFVRPAGDSPSPPVVITSTSTGMGRPSSSSPMRIHYSIQHEVVEEEEEVNDGEEDDDGGMQLLFGLEVYVKQIHGLHSNEIKKTPPVIAFSFLDFAPQLIRCHHKKVSCDERHDDDDKGWTYERGKSCLFTSSAHSLLRSLRRVPLVMMLVDEINTHQARLYASACLSLQNFRPRKLWLWGPESVETWGHAEEECVVMYNSCYHHKHSSLDSPNHHQQVALLDVSITMTCYGPAESHPLLSQIKDKGMRSSNSPLRQQQQWEGREEESFIYLHHHHPEGQRRRTGIDGEEEEEEGGETIEQLLHDVPDPSRLGGWVEEEERGPDIESRVLPEVLESPPPPLFYLAPRKKTHQNQAAAAAVRHPPPSRMMMAQSDRDQYHPKHHHQNYQVSPGLPLSIIRSPPCHHHRQSQASSPPRSRSIDKKRSSSHDQHHHPYWRPAGIAPPFSPGQRTRMQLQQQHQYSSSSSHSPTRR